MPVLVGSPPCTIKSGTTLRNSRGSLYQQEKPEKLGAVVVALHAELYKVPASFGAFCRPELYIDLPHSCLESHLSRCQVYENDDIGNWDYGEMDTFPEQGGS